MFSNANPFIRVEPVVFRKGVFSLRNMENVNFVNSYGKNVGVNKIVTDANVFGKTSKLHFSMLLNASVGLSAAFSRKCFCSRISVEELILRWILLNFALNFPELECFQLIE